MVEIIGEQGIFLECKNLYKFSQIAYTGQHTKFWLFTLKETRITNKINSQGFILANSLYLLEIIIYTCWLFKNILHKWQNWLILKIG